MRLFRAVFHPDWSIWRPAARPAWWALAPLTLALDLYGLYLTYFSLRQPCLPGRCSGYQITAQQAQVFLASGLPYQAYVAGNLAMLSLSLVAWVGVGFLLFRLKPRDPLILAISLALITFGSTAFGSLDAVVSFAGPLLARTARIVTVIGQICFAFFYIFPDGRFVPRWTGWITLGWAAAWLPGLLFLTYSPFDRAPVAFIAVVTSIILAQAVRYRRAGPVVRQQVKWVVSSIMLAIAYFLAFIFTFWRFPALDASLPGFVLNLLLYAFMALVPISVGVAMLRYRLWDIDVIIRRALVYTLLTALLGGLYAGGVIFFQEIVRLVSGETSPAAVVFTTLLIAALFAPLRRRLQGVIDRRFYRSRYNAEHAIAAFTAALRTEADLADMTGGLAAVVASTIQPESISIWLKAAAPEGRAGKRIEMPAQVAERRSPRMP